MSDQTTTRDASRVTRALHTPMGDLVRGRITGPVRPGRWGYGQAGYREVVLNAGLPSPLASLVMDVTSWTRLRRREKADVARELVAHFRDGLASGATGDQLSAGFGNPVRAARLIRRAKKRNRSLLWHAWVNTWKAVGAVLLLGLLLYGVLAVRFYTGRPNIKRNIAAELNAPVLAMPESDKAWPLYRQAMLALPPQPQAIMDSGRWPAIEPADALWPEAVAYVDSMQQTIELARRAAALPHLGYLLTDGPDQQLLAHSAVVRGADPSALAPAPPPSDNPSMLGILLPHLGLTRELARDLAADARVALSRSDGTRLEADISTLLGMGRHLDEHPFLISKLVGVAIGAVAIDMMGKVLAENPALLTDDQLIGLAHRFAAMPAEIDVSVEQALFEDTVQRVYTDDGHGDGRLAGGSSASFGVGITGSDPLITNGPAGPVVSALVAGRKEAMAEWNRVMDAARSEAQSPMWTWTSLPGQQIWDENERRPLYKVRYYPISALIPALGSVATQSNRVSMQRDAMTTAIALELWRRRHGEYPDSLIALTPEYLPTAPVDRFDGRPLKYTLRDGKPVIYSAGRDGDDDGGRPPAGDMGGAYALRWAPPSEVQSDLADPVRRTLTDGDWVIWPPVKYDGDGKLLPPG